jgi:antirestriction protein ArdC
MPEKFDIFQNVTDTIMAALEEGTVPWRKPWTFHGDETLHRNFNSRRPYRGVNQWLLEIAAMRKGYELPYWLTFKGAQKLGGKVRKGEKSEIVVFWKKIMIEDKENPGKKKQIFMLRYFRVFNVAQIDGLGEIPAPEAREDFSPIEECEKIVGGYADGPSISHGGDRACYVPAFDAIRMPNRADFRSVEEYYSTLFHEMIHSTGHEKRLGRKELADMASFGDESYSKEELTAEMGAAMLCGVAGIVPRTIDNSAAYIANWLKALKNDKKLVVVAAGKAHAAADHILGVKYAEEEE